MNVATCKKGVWPALECLRQADKRTSVSWQQNFQDWYIPPNKIYTRKLTRQVTEARWPYLEYCFNLYEESERMKAPNAIRESSLHRLLSGQSSRGVPADSESLSTTLDVIKQRISSLSVSTEARNRETDHQKGPLRFLERCMEQNFMLLEEWQKNRSDRIFDLMDSHTKETVNLDSLMKLTAAYMVCNNALKQLQNF
eukprot:GHVN01002449.1.p1 GENE.GHVN01002449.1~~GHVN01002449.1.p1  ORF type:complete len:197 (-),score=6.41 GHVN01002449.1:22-612(-)